MKFRIKIAMALVAAIALASPLSDISASAVVAPQHQGYRGGRSDRPNRQDRPSAPNRPHRPDRQQRPDRPNRPQRPNRPDRHDRPGRPERPPMPPRPPRPQRPPHHGRPLPPPPPPRPYRPVPRRVYRPVVPPAYVPYHNAPVINAILGLRFGLSLANSLVALADGGYTVDGYSNDNVYLRGVRNLGYVWDDAILYYDDYGRLANVSFYDSSYSYNTSRYDSVYSILCREYGIPATRDSMRASWYDRTGNNFVTLSLEYSSASGGSPRYYTTLTYGN